MCVDPFGGECVSFITSSRRTFSPTGSIKTGLDAGCLSAPLHGSAPALSVIQAPSEGGGQTHTHMHTCTHTHTHTHTYTHTHTHTHMHTHTQTRTHTRTHTHTHSL